MGPTGRWPAARSRPTPRTRPGRRRPPCRVVLTVGLATIAVEPRPLPIPSSAHPQAQVSYREPFTSPLPGWRSTEVVPSPSSVAAARRFARGREGTVAFAVVDSEGRLRGLEAKRSFVSASLVKVMLLLAYLERVESAAASVSPEGRAMLEPMIEVSDNAAASQVYGLVGADGLEQVARRAGMTGFTASPPGATPPSPQATMHGYLVSSTASQGAIGASTYATSSRTSRLSRAGGSRRTRAIAGKSSSRAAGGRPRAASSCIRQRWSSTAISGSQ